MSLITAVGVMSGTSMDGIDVALVRTDGEAVVERGPFHAFSYDPALQGDLRAVIADPARAEHDLLADIERRVTKAHAEAVAGFLAAQGLTASAVDLVGFHGQTVFHAPRRGLSRQLFDGPRAAARLGIDVVFRFRHADVAAGGEGAPLAPLYHRALVQAGGLTGPVVVLNLGGVANVTFIDGDTVIACDTGPASALLDDFMQRRRGEAFDRDGALAASGTVDAAVLSMLMDHPFFAAPPPKSLDRNAFHTRAAAIEALPDADGAATLAAFTVEATARIVDHLPARPRRWLVTGGGRHNATFMRRLAGRLGVPVDPVEAVGWNGDAMEAECFAYLAVRSLRGLPLSLPTTTGVPRPMPGGEVVRRG